MNQPLARDQLSLFELPTPPEATESAAARGEAAAYDLTPLPASLLRECPVSEEPRERLLTAGAAALSDAELVALLIDGRRRGTPTLPTARELLDRHGGLAALPSLGPRMLASSGLATAQAVQLLAACELACRLSRQAAAERPPMTQPAQLAAYLTLRFARRDQEVFGAVFLDTRTRLITARELYRGTLARTLAEPREIFKLAILCGAAAVVLFHNHPSADPSPSPEDLQVTRRFRDAGEAIGVRLLDHLILGGRGRWCSLQERGAC